MDGKSSTDCQLYADMLHHS